MDQYLGPHSHHLSVLMCLQVNAGMHNGNCEEEDGNKPPENNSDGYWAYSWSFVDCFWLVDTHESGRCELLCYCREDFSTRRDLKKAAHLGVACVRRPLPCGLPSGHSEVAHFHSVLPCS